MKYRVRFAFMYGDWTSFELALDAFRGFLHANQIQREDGVVIAQDATVRNQGDKNHWRGYETNL